MPKQKHTALLAALPRAPELAAFIALSGQVLLITAHSDVEEKFDEIVASLALP